MECPRGTKEVQAHAKYNTEEVERDGLSMNVRKAAHAITGHKEPFWCTKCGSYASAAAATLTTLAPHVKINILIEIRKTLKG